MDVELLTLVHHGVPNFYGIIPRHPDFVTQITGITSSGNVNGYARNLAARHAEILEVGDVGFGNVFEEFAGGWPLQCKRRDLLRDVLNLNIHVVAVLAKPAQARIGRCPAVLIFFEAGDGSVVDDLAFFIAPAAVDDLADSDLVDVTSDDAIHKTCGVPPGHQVLIQRTDINQRGSIADGVVFVLVMDFVHADGVIARPLAVTQAMAERERSFVKRGSDGQGRPLLVLSILRGAQSLALEAGLYLFGNQPRN